MPASPAAHAPSDPAPSPLRVHARQPAIVESGRFDDWLAPDAPKEALLDIVRNPHPGPYRVRPASRLVNNVRNDGPEVLGEAVPGD